MKIAILGTTGLTGYALYKEALKRGHEVTALIRDEKKAKQILGDDTKYKIVDALNLKDNDLDGFDVFINAYANHEDSSQYMKVAKRIVEIVTDKPIRYVQLLGASSLKTQDGKLLIEHIMERGDATGSEPWYANEVFKFLKSLPNNVNWTGVSPQQMLYPGMPTDFKISSDSLIYNILGHSQVSNGTYAVAILDEIENPNFINSRFAVGEV
ncbi:MAG: NAD(P)H-binding protein [Lactobacillaceae bacterium]|jgi:putative NADH-flavin reductase|nr:NAD(P)H-binding protein [Lactobacillaceae bacterium]